MSNLRNIRDRIYELTGQLFDLPMDRLRALYNEVENHGDDAAVSDAAEKYLQTVLSHRVTQEAGKHKYCDFVTVAAMGEVCDDRAMPGTNPPRCKGHKDR